MTRCVMPRQVSGGRTKANVRLQTTALPTKRSHRWVHLCVSGFHYMKVIRVSVASLIDRQQRNKLQRMGVVIQSMTLDAIHVVKSSCVHISSAICLRLLYVHLIHNSRLLKRSDLRLSLVHSSLH